MARYPLHPRLSRLMVEARRRGVARDGCAVAALLSAGDRLPARAPHASRSDLLVLLEAEWSPYAARLFRQLGGAEGAGARATGSMTARIGATANPLADARGSDRSPGRGTPLGSGGVAPNSTTSDSRRHDGEGEREAALLL